MTTCLQDLTPSTITIRTMIPERMLGLMRDPDRPNFPVPWFVAWFNGKPDYRVIDAGKIVSAVKNKTCWICGKRLGDIKAFVIGPMCACTKTTSEPPCHFACAEFAVKICPFLSHPKMIRNAKDLPDVKDVAGFGFSRNPGCTAIWKTKSFECFYANQGERGILFRVGPVHSVSWWAEGREATREEVVDSIQSGLPALRELVDLEKPENRAAALAELERAVVATMNLIPGGN